MACFLLSTTFPHELTDPLSGLSTHLPFSYIIKGLAQIRPGSKVDNKNGK